VKEEARMRVGGALHYLNRNKFNYISVLPALIIIVIIGFYPLSYTIYLSFYKGGLGRLQFAGFEHYQRIVIDDFFWESFRISFVYTAISVVITLITGLAVGILLAQPERVIKIFKYVVIMPWIVSYVVAGILWRWVLNAEFGILNEMLGYFGVGRVGWLSRPTSAFIMVTVSGVWKMLPFTALLFYAAVISLPQEIYESATVDGATTFQKFWQLTIPLLKPTFLVVMVVLTIHFFNFITLMITITGGGPARATTVLPLYMWRIAFNYLRLGYGSVNAIVLFAVNIALAIGYIRMLRTEKIY
jgi:multiple sugar transport system permease protein